MLKKHAVGVRRVTNAKDEHSSGDEYVVEGECGGFGEKRRARAADPRVQERG